MEVDAEILDRDQLDRIEASNGQYHPPRLSRTLYPAIELLERHAPPISRDKSHQPSGACRAIDFEEANKHEFEGWNDCCCVRIVYKRIGRRRRRGIKSRIETYTPCRSDDYTSKVCISVDRRSILEFSLKTRDVPSRG